MSITTHRVFKKEIFALIFLSLSMQPHSAFADSSNANSNSNNGSSGSEKVTICHFPGGDRTKGVPMSISKSALASHKMHHGDIVGDCPASSSATAALTYRETNFKSCTPGSNKGRSVNVQKNGNIAVSEVSCQ